jgi:hypothetical protein
MGRYDQLNEYLKSAARIEINMSFSDIEKILGFELPSSAYTYNAWWANGGHSQASSWIDAGYKVSRIDVPRKTVTFCKSGAPVPKEHKQHKVSVNRQTIVTSAPAPVFPAGSKSMTVCGYEFHYLQDLVPECDAAGNAIKLYPQNDYDNKKGLTLSYHGEGAFCRFSINAEDWPGVYLWVVDGQIIYIGETAGLRQRFNMGYGNISPRNCYVGGQSTNCKMNKVVLGHYERGKAVSLYFYNTPDYKKVELDLLGQIYTPYNVKDN